MTSEEILQQIQEEQNSLKSKKNEVRKLIDNLQSRLDEYTDKTKSYRSARISPQIISEIVRSLVSAHKLEVDISSNLLRSYKELFELKRKTELEQESSIDNSMLREMMKALGGLEIAEMEEASSD
jgi:type I site-specific restriction endonuclease